MNRTIKPIDIYCVGRDRKEIRGKIDGPRGKVWFVLPVGTYENMLREKTNKYGIKSMSNRQMSLIEKSVMRSIYRKVTNGNI